MTHGQPPWSNGIGLQNKSRDRPFYGYPAPCADAAAYLGCPTSTAWIDVNRVVSQRNADASYRAAPIRQ